MSQPAAVSRWNLANQLTVLRLLLVPVLAWLLYEIGAASDELPWRIAAFLVFIGASATDSVDGEMRGGVGSSPTSASWLIPLLTRL